MSNSCCHWDQLYQVWTFETKTEDFLSLNIEILVVETKIYRNWKILFISRPRLSKMMRPRLYPESCWSLCAVMLLITRGTNISHTQRGDKHPHLLQLLSSLLDSDFSPPPSPTPFPSLSEYPYSANSDCSGLVKCWDTHSMVRSWC